MATTRLSVNINSETRDALQNMSERDEITITEVVRRAVSVYDFVSREVLKGKRLQLVDNDEVLTLTFMGYGLD